MSFHSYDTDIGGNASWGDAITVVYTEKSSDPRRSISSHLLVCPDKFTHAISSYFSLGLGKSAKPYIQIHIDFKLIPV